MDNLIIHHLFKRDTLWYMAYEIRGEWKPKTKVIKGSMFNLERM